MARLASASILFALMTTVAAGKSPSRFQLHRDKSWPGRADPHKPSC